MTEVWSKRRILPLIFTVKSFTKSLLIIIGFAKLLLWFCSFQITRFKTRKAALMFKQTSDIDNDRGEKLDNDDDPSLQVNLICIWAVVKTTIGFKN